MDIYFEAKQTYISPIIYHEGGKQSLAFSFNPTSSEWHALCDYSLQSNILIPDYASVVEADGAATNSIKD